MFFLKRTVRLSLILLFVATIPLSNFAQNRTKALHTIGGETVESRELTQKIKSIMDSVGVPGLSIAIINNSEIVYHNTFGVANTNTGIKVNEKSIFEGASLSKPLFAYFVMKQVDKGIIDLDTPLYKYMPYPAIDHDERYKLITARMVLSHTTGFPNWRSFNDDDELDIKFKPGTQFHYSGEGYRYLAKVLASLYETDLKGLDAIFRKQVAKPLNAKRQYYTWNNYIAKHKVYGHKNGKPTNNGKGEWDGETFGAAHSLHTEAEAYATFLTALLNQKGLAESTFEEMFSEQVSLPKSHKLYKQIGQTGWTLGFAQKPTDYGTMYQHTGNNHDFQSYMMILPKKDFGIVFFMNAAKSIPFIQQLNAFMGPIF